MIKAQTIQDVIIALVLGCILTFVFSQQILELIGFGTAGELRILLKVGALIFMLILAIVFTTGMGAQDIEKV